MIIDSKKKIQLCVSEISIVESLLDTRMGDDFCCRLLTLYVAMRLDDLTKILDKETFGEEAKKELSHELKMEYNEQFRQLRDKLGAHFQQMEGDGDLMHRAVTFRAFNYEDVKAIVGESRAVYELLYGDVDTVPSGFVNEKDKQMASDVLVGFYSDDKGALTTGTLDLFGVNKGGMVSGGKAAQKAQHLRSLQMMHDVVYMLYQPLYEDMAVKRLFKRFWIALVVNFYDNLVTRTDIKPDAAQYDKGLDADYIDTLCKRDNKAEMEHSFERFEAQTGMSAYMKRLRRVREVCCAHLDETMPLDDINNMLDCVDEKEVARRFTTMAEFFEYLLNNTFLFRMVALPPRILMHGVNFETMEGQRDFYGNEVEGLKARSKMADATPEELWHAIRKHTADGQEAWHYAEQMLKSHDEGVFWRMANVLGQRLETDGLDNRELWLIYKLLKSAVRGFPERLQAFLITNIYGHKDFVGTLLLLNVLADVAQFDKDGQLMDFLSQLEASGNVLYRAYQRQILLHACIQGTGGIRFADSITQQVDTRFSESLEFEDKPPVRLATFMGLANVFWEFHKREAVYGQLIDGILMDSLDDFCKYVKASDEKGKIWADRASHHRLIELTCLLIDAEEERKQTPNIFKALWCSRLVRHESEDKRERLFAALCNERLGKTDYVRWQLEILRKQFPLDDETKTVLEDFYRLYGLGGEK